MHQDFDEKEIGLDDGVGLGDDALEALVDDVFLGEEDVMDNEDDEEDLYFEIFDDEDDL